MSSTCTFLDWKLFSAYVPNHKIGGGGHSWLIPWVYVCAQSLWRSPRRVSYWADETLEAVILDYWWKTYYSIVTRYPIPVIVTGESLVHGMITMTLAQPLTCHASLFSLFCFVSLSSLSVSSPFPPPCPGRRSVPTDHPPCLAPPWTQWAFSPKEIAAVFGVDPGRDSWFLAFFWGVSWTSSLPPGCVSWYAPPHHPHSRTQNS